MDEIYSLNDEKWGAYSMINVIHIFGASGSGTTTLGEAIDKTLGYKHLDVDDYFWVPSDPPYEIKRAPNERQRLLRNDITNSQKSVISGSLCGWGDIFIPYFDLAIFVDTSTELRIRRIKEREYSKFDNRILPGGDLYYKHTDFVEWAKGYDKVGVEQRSRALHKEWMKKLKCPVITVDGALPIDCLISQIGEIIKKFNKM